MEIITYENFMYAFRFLGRIGFLLLLIALYRVYLAFSSPLVKKEHKYFIRLFGTSVVLSLIVLIINYFLVIQWLNTALVVFNVATTYILSFYLFHHGSQLEEYRYSEEYKALSLAMDSMIRKLKS